MADSVPEKHSKKIIIVGGGFAGIRAALDLVDASTKHPNLGLEIKLISDKTHFEYHAFLYKVVNGASPLEVCIPLSEIFADKKIEILNDTVQSLDVKNKKICSTEGCHYDYDYLVLALGSEPEYFNIPGLEKYSYGLKTIKEALVLNKHLHKTFTECHITYDKIKKECLVHIVVVGGGPAGVEVAGELASYTKELADKHQIDHDIIKIDIIEMSNRLLPMLSESASKAAFERLKELGVNISLQKIVKQAELEKIVYKDQDVDTKTVIWTAGTKANSFYKTVNEFKLNKKGQVKVDKYLRPLDSGIYDHDKIIDHIFIAGDAADTNQTGLAAVAFNHGKNVAINIINIEHKRPLEPLKPQNIISAIPIGKNWAYIETRQLFKLKIKGYFGFIIRKFIDLSYLATVLPLTKALKILIDNESLTDNCETCKKHLE